MSGAGRLFVVATPIGNLEDMSARAVRVLGQVAVVAAEDTRSAQKLFQRFAIAARAVSYFDGNEVSRSEELVARLVAGESVAVISEAGMPGISDPGERLVAAAIAAGVAVEVIPGPSAALSALVGSGLPTGRFRFLGFLSRGGPERDADLASLRAERDTAVLYEAPGRTGATLGDLAGVLGGGRRACVARELTKIHEEYARGTLAELAARFADEAPRGEVTIVLEGAGDAAEPALDESQLEAEVDRRIAVGESPKEIAAALAIRTGLPRRQIYQLAVARKR